MLQDQCFRLLYRPKFPFTNAVTKYFQVLSDGSLNLKHTNPCNKFQCSTKSWVRYEPRFDFINSTLVKFILLRILNLKIMIKLFECLQ